MKTMKKIFAAILVCLFVLSAVQIAVSAQDEEIAVVETVDDAAQAVEAIEAGEVKAQDSPAMMFGKVLGSIVFSPFLLIDFIVWVFSGFNVHIFYSHLFG
jgi:hypothetical protein